MLLCQGVRSPTEIKAEGLHRKSLPTAVALLEKTRSGVYLFKLAFLKMCVSEPSQNPNSCYLLFSSVKLNLLELQAKASQALGGKHQRLFYA